MCSSMAFIEMWLSGVLPSLHEDPLWYSLGTFFWYYVGCRANSHKLECDNIEMRTFRKFFFSCLESLGAELVGTIVSA